jgi:hypothetical protein
VIELARYLETLIRFRLRFVILLLIAPLSLGTSSVLLLRGYEGTAGLWINDPNYMGQNVAPVDWNPRLSPAQNTTDALKQLLATHAFDRQVSEKLRSTGSVSEDAVLAHVADSLGSDLHVTADGSHLVRLSFSDPSEAVALAVLRTTIALFLEHLSVVQHAQLDATTTFLSTQVTSTESALTVAQQGLAGYLAAHPSQRVPAGGEDTGIAELDRLSHQVRQSQTELANLRVQLAQARFLGAAAQRLVETNTQVVDQPRIAQSGPIGDGRSLTAALFVGLLCVLAAGIYLAVLVWADQTARDAKELERRLKVPVLTTIPLIGMQERF